MWPQLSFLRVGVAERRVRDGGPSCSALGLDPTNPVAFVDDHCVLDTDIAKRGLASLNDHGATFAELADVIEYAF